jgi:hypothetical protein
MEKLKELKESIEEMVSNNRVYPEQKELTKSITKSLIKGILKDQLKDLKEYTRIMIKLHDINVLFIYNMTEKFKNAAAVIDDDNYDEFSSIFARCIKTENFTENSTMEIKIEYIYLVKPIATGGKKAVIKYTVKQLQAIASKNNIKITKKVDGKTVRLNKQGLMTRLKRYKVI